VGTLDVPDFLEDLFSRVEGFVVRGQKRDAGVKGSGVKN
jgi:hypothetical protein